MSSVPNHWYLERIGSRGNRPAFFWDGGSIAYDQLYVAAQEWMKQLDRRDISAGDVVVVQGDHSPSSFALMLALAIKKTIVVPLTKLPKAVLDARCAMADANWLIINPDKGKSDITRLAVGSRHTLLDELAGKGQAGLILFSSGSSGIPKTCLLNLDQLLETTRTEKKSFVTLAFLLFDHIGGINTMINILGQGGTIVVPTDRSIVTTGSLIENHRISLLPTSPTFLKMLLMSDVASKYDLSSLELITYGTEVMPETTLKALQAAFPNIRLKQTYGLSEIGIVPTRSKSAGSLWVEIGGKGIEYQVRDDILWLRASTAMIGYLNAPSPFDGDGWLNTGDRVEVDGSYLRILGRDSELINIGGEKVHPTEVENVLLDAPNIVDVTVNARPSPIMGSVLMATVSLVKQEDSRNLRARLGQYCRERLEPHKVPMMFKIANTPLHSERFKKTREPHP
ncbi:MAG: AMP-binding protein [Rhizobiaceae bacterium]|nr:AMP-binding protein [Rhizobiaceae bacterium]